MYKDKEQQQDE